MWLEMAVKFGIQAMRLTPDYEQRKEKELLKYQEVYLSEKNKPAHKRNDQIFANAREKINHILQGYLK